MALKNFTVWYFRYYQTPNSDDLHDGGIQSKTIRAKDFNDAEARWNKQNPCGDIFRDWTSIIDDETDEEFDREDTFKDGKVIKAEKWRF